jgi:hypothetical protein
MSSEVKPIRVAVTPPYFSGNKDSDPYAFLNSYIRAANSNFWTPGICVRQFPAYLRDKALGWFEAKTSERDRNGLGQWTWEELKTEFLSSTGPLETRNDQLEWKLLTLKQTKDENCSDFMIKVYNLCNRLDPYMPDARRIKLCIRGLRKDAMKAVNMQSPSTYKELTRLLLKFDETYIIAGRADSDDEADAPVNLAQQGPPGPPPSPSQPNYFPSGQMNLNQATSGNLDLSHLVCRIRNLEMSEQRGGFRRRLPNQNFRNNPSRFSNNPRGEYRNQQSEQSAIVPYDQSGRRQQEFLPPANYRPPRNPYQYGNSVSSRGFPFQGQNTYRNTNNFPRYGDRQRQRPISYPPPNYYPQQGNRSNTCYRCGQSGHFIQECRGSPVPNTGYPDSLNINRRRMPGNFSVQQNQIPQN